MNPPEVGPDRGPATPPAAGPGRRGRTPLTTLPRGPRCVGPPLDVPAWRRVLAVCVSDASDVVLTTPALHALRRALRRDATLDLLVSPAGAAVGPLIADVDDVVALQTAWQDVPDPVPLDPRREGELVTLLRVRGYDALIVFTSAGQSPWPMAYVGYLAGVGVRVGASAETAGSVLSHRVTHLDDDEHQAMRGLSLLAAAGITGLAPDPVDAAPPDRLRLRLRPQDQQAARGLLPPNAVLLLPGAEPPSRHWTPEGFAEVAAVLAADGHPVRVLGGERNAVLAARIADTAGVPAVPDVLDGPGTAAAVAQARLVIGDGGVGMQLAEAFGTPAVTLFSGATSESRYAPRHGAAALLRVPTPCSPCGLAVCPFADGRHEPPCLDIRPGVVVSAARALLARDDRDDRKQLDDTGRQDIRGAAATPD